MKVIVACPSGHRFRVHQSSLGKIAKCPHVGCGIDFVLEELASDLNSGVVNSLDEVPHPPRDECKRFPVSPAVSDALPLRPVSAVICPRCGEPLRATAQRCGLCGAALETTIPLAANDRTASAISGQTSEPSVPRNAQHSPRSKRPAILFAILIAVVVVYSGIIGLQSCIERRDAEVAERQRSAEIGAEKEEQERAEVPVTLYPIGDGYSHGVENGLMYSIGFASEGLGSLTVSYHVENVGKIPRDVAPLAWALVGPDKSVYVPREAEVLVGGNFGKFEPCFASTTINPGTTGAFLVKYELPARQRVFYFLIPNLHRTAYVIDRDKLKP